MKKYQINKRWILLYFIMVLGGGIFIGISNYVVDPFEQYHKPFLHKPYYEKDQRYRNAGLIKNYEFDSVVVGTSMMQNFKLSDIEQNLNYKTPLKLSISGGSAYELGKTLSTALQFTEVKNVLFVLDVFSFKGIPKRLRYGKGSMPFYLYDQKFYNDYPYLMSLDTLGKTWNVLSRDYNQNDPLFNLDNMFQWQHFFEDDFGRLKLLEEWKSSERNKNFNTNFNILDYSFDNLKDSFDLNLLPLILKYKNTKFTVIFPPYSIMAYKDIEEKLWLDSYLKFKRYISDHLVKLTNVSLYDFQIAEEISYKLDNYKDLTHFHQDINLWILENLKENKFLVEANSINYFESTLLHQIMTYHVEELLND